MRLAWLTDLHLNFVSLKRRQVLYQTIREQHPDAILVGGDWAEADTLNQHLEEWHNHIPIPTYFVLGNHDYYNGEIATTRASLNSKQTNLHYLTTSPVISLTNDTALIGHDSWADGRFGDFFLSNVRLNDYILIADLRGLTNAALFQKLKELGDDAAARLESQLRQALTTHKEVLLLTHVPPFREACWHEGQISDDNYLPHFACQAVGLGLKAIMQEHPTHTLRVYCGHTHSPGQANILPNLTVHTGAATYGEPAIQQIIDVHPHD